MMHKVHSNEMASSVAKWFHKEEYIYHQLRKRNKLTLPTRRTEKGKRSLAFGGQLIWNAFDNKSKEQGYEVSKWNLVKNKDTIDSISFMKGTAGNFNNDEKFIYF